MSDVAELLWEKLKLREQIGLGDDSCRELIAKALLEAAESYGRHKPTCCTEDKIVISNFVVRGHGPCDCGWDNYRKLLSP